MGNEKLNINIVGIILFATCVNRKSNYAKFRLLNQRLRNIPVFYENLRQEFLNVIRLITSFGRNRVTITSSRWKQQLLYEHDNKISIRFPIWNWKHFCGPDTIIIISLPFNYYYYFYLFILFIFFYPCLAVLDGFQYMLYIHYIY